MRTITLYKLVLFTACLLSRCVGFTQTGAARYNLLVEISNHENRFVQLKANDQSERRLLDSVKVVNGKIEVGLVLDEPKCIELTLDYFSIGIMVDTGFNHFVWDGKSYLKDISKKELSRLGQLYDSLFVNPAREKLVDLYAKKTEHNQAVNDSLDSIQRIVVAEHDRNTQRFIRQHRNSFFALYLLRHDYQNWLVDTVRKLFNQLPSHLKKHPSAKAVHQYLKDQGVFKSGHSAASESHVRVALIDFQGPPTGCIQRRRKIVSPPEAWAF